MVPAATVNTLRTFSVGGGCREISSHPEQWCAAMVQLTMLRI
jgi:hypothetical protein